MGADLITYFVYGPAKLPLDKMEAAKKQAREAMQVAIDYLIVDGSYREGDFGEDVYRARLAAIDTTPIRHLLTGSGGTPIPLDALDEFTRYNLERLSDIDPDAVVENLYQVWNEGARDVTWREVPGNPEMIGFVAGDTSWGDDPAGFGYEILQEGNLTGIFPVLGIQ
jgi:hypothetical protein